MVSDISVLVLGNESDWDSYQKFCRQLQKHRGKLNWVTATYSLLEKNRVFNEFNHGMLSEVLSFVEKAERFKAEREIKRQSKKSRGLK